MDVSVSITKYNPVILFGLFVNNNVSAYSKSQMLMRFRNTNNILIYEGFKYNMIDDNQLITNLLFEYQYDNFCDTNIKGVIGNDLLSNINKFKDLKIKNISKLYRDFNDSSSSINDFFLHKTCKSVVKLSSLVKMKLKPACINVNSNYSNLFSRIYQKNTYKYSIGLYIEELLGEFNSILNSCKIYFIYFHITFIFFNISKKSNI